MTERGVGYIWPATFVLKELERFGHRQVILKSDQENSLKVLAQAVKTLACSLVGDRDGTCCAVATRTRKDVEITVGHCNGQKCGPTFAVSRVAHRARKDSSEPMSQRSTPRRIRSIRTSEKQELENRISSM